MGLDEKDDYGVRLRKGGSSDVKQREPSSDPLKCEPRPEESKKYAKSKNEQATIFTNRNKVFSLNIELDLPSILLFLIAFAMRVYRLEQPRSVVFDELHYVKFASLYASNTFFFDSQPPLGKQIIALAAYVAGYSNTAAVDRIGGEYSTDVPIFLMRLVPCVFGSFLPPISYQILLLMGFSQVTSSLGGLLMLLDTAMLTQTRFVLMEGILIFFCLLGLFAALKFCEVNNDRSRWFSIAWWSYLILSAILFTCALCVKYIGALSIVLGVYIMCRDLWKHIGNSSCSNLSLWLQGICRGAVFLLIPAFVYISVFQLHLSILTKAGPHDTIMTSAFQASLEGGLASITKGQPTHIAHGSQITLRHSHGRTCWLHSHGQVYPLRYPDGRGSSHQQQVTCYSYKDVNNWWIVKRPDNPDIVVEEPVDKIKHGDVIEIVHGMTSRLLNSHDVASPMSPALQEVSCYIDYNITKFPPQTLWKLDITNRDSVGDHWQSIHSQIRLIHMSTGQALKFSGKQLPEWGYNQHEVVTDRVIDQVDTVFNVEEHRYTKKKDDKEREMDMVSAEFVPLEPTHLSFWQKFAELQYKMFVADNENVEDHMFSSEPVEWPLLTRGIAYWVSSKSNAQIFLIGNPILWYTATLALPVYMTILGVLLLRRRRLCYDIPEDLFWNICATGEILVVAFGLHYLPFFFMDKSLFLHHYLPASMFSILLIAALVEHIDQLLSFLVRPKLPWINAVYSSTVSTWLILVIWGAISFSVFSYGTTPLTASDIEKLRWLDSWSFIVHQK